MSNWRLIRTKKKKSLLNEVEEARVELLRWESVSRWRTKIMGWLIDGIKLRSNESNRRSRTALMELVWEWNAKREERWKMEESRRWCRLLQRLLLEMEMKLTLVNDGVIDLESQRLRNVILDHLYWSWLHLVATRSNCCIFILKLVINDRQKDSSCL